MLLIRQKYFTKADKIIFNEAKKFIRDFGNADNSYKNLDIVNKLSLKDKLNITKRLPNYINKKNLKKNKLIDVPEDVWQSIKKAGYFNEGDAGNITREQFNKGLNKHFNYNNYKPDVYKYTRSGKGKQLRKSIKEINKSNTNYKVHSEKEKDYIFNRVSDPSKTYNIPSEDSINYYKNLGLDAHIDDYLGATDAFSFPKKASAIKSNIDELNNFHESLAKINESEKSAVFNVLKKTQGEAVARKTMALGNNPPILNSSGTIYSGKNTGPGIIDHEAGHIIDIIRSDSRKIPKRKKVKYLGKGNGWVYDDRIDKKREYLESITSTTPENNSLANAANSINQYGNESVASIRGNSRYKTRGGNLMDEADKNQLDAISSYLVDKESGFLRPSVKGHKL